MKDKALTKEMCEAFTRNLNGTWTTIHPIAITNDERMTGLGTGITVDPGMVLAGLDMVDWLETHYPLR